MGGSFYAKLFAAADAGAEDSCGQWAGGEAPAQAGDSAPGISGASPHAERRRAQAIAPRESVLGGGVPGPRQGNISAILHELVGAAENRISGAWLPCQCRSDHLGNRAKGKLRNNMDNGDADG